METNFSVESASVSPTLSPEASQAPQSEPWPSGAVGGWFAALIGSTIWVPCFVIPHNLVHPWFAFGNIALTLLSIGAGTWLWFQRRHLSLAVAMQLLILIAFLPTAIVILSSVWWGIGDTPRSALRVLLVYPVLAIQMLILFRPKKATP